MCGAGSRGAREQNNSSHVTLTKPNTSPNGLSTSPDMADPRTERSTYTKYFREIRHVFRTLLGSRTQHVFSLKTVSSQRSKDDRIIAQRNRHHISTSLEEFSEIAQLVTIALRQEQKRGIEFEHIHIIIPFDLLPKMQPNTHTSPPSIPKCRSLKALICTRNDPMHAVNAAISCADKC